MAEQNRLKAANFTVGEVWSDPGLTTALCAALAKRLGELLARRRVRRPPIAGAIRDAERTGKKVKDAVIGADGSVTLTFDAAEPATDAVEKWIGKHAHQS